VEALTHPRASADERDRLVADFIRLCEIESPSRRERTMADAVTTDLRALGLDVEEDDSRRETGSDAGNLLARIPAPDGARTILLSAHLDTVPLDAPVAVERSEEGVLTNRNEGIVGADNKAAVAVILGVVRRLVAEAAPVGVEILFTTCEELALAGAKAFDLGRLSSEFGFVFDHASPIGELIVAAPTYFSVEAQFRGKAAHAGLAPEQGHNAIEAAAAALASLRFGRLDDMTVSNVGRIVGGTASNVVAERCRVECEARSIDHDRAAQAAADIVDAMTQAATDRACDVEIDVQELARGFRMPKGAATVAIASAALEELGIEPRQIVTGGGSDANSFQARGFECLNVANGTQAAHQPDERVTVEALETMLDVALGIVHHSAT
jgi:tripeptide aminopeptidase